MANERRKALTVYQRIIRAGERGTGLRLSWEDVCELAADEQIRAVAQNDDADAEEPHD